MSAAFESFEPDIQDFLRDCTVKPDSLFSCRWLLLLTRASSLHLEILCSEAVLYVNPLQQEQSEDSNAILLFDGSRPGFYRER